MTNANTQVIATIGEFDLVALAISEKYTDSAANREKKRAGDPRKSSKGNPALFLEIEVKPRGETAHGVKAGTSFSGVANVVAS